MLARLRRNGLRAAAVLAVVAAAAIAAGTAQAALVDEDDVATLGSGSFEFRNGNVDWYYEAAYIYPHLTGEIRLDGANGSCARMRMEYFDDSASLDVKTGGVVCAPDARTHTYTVDLDPDHDPRIDLLKVSLQKKTASGGWTTVESAYFKPTLSTDKVRLTSDGVDFGDDTWGIASPVGSGTMDWVQGEDMDLTPHLRGVLYLNNSAGLCARVDLLYLDRSGWKIDEKPGGKVCATDNSLDAFNVDLAPLTSDEVAMVTVKLQTLATDGNWRDVSDGDASQTVFIDE